MFISSSEVVSSLSNDSLGKPGREATVIVECAEKFAAALCFPWVILEVSAPGITSPANADCSDSSMLANSTKGSEGLEHVPFLRQ